MKTIKFYQEENTNESIFDATNFEIKEEKNNNNLEFENAFDEFFMNDIFNYESGFEVA